MEVVSIDRRTGTIQQVYGLHDPLSTVLVLLLVPIIPSPTLPRAMFY